MPVAPVANNNDSPARKVRSKVDPNETSRARFVRLAQMRTSSVIEATRKLALLGNKSQYEYDDEDIAKIEAAVTESVKAAVASLRNGRPSQSSFSL